MTPRRAPYTWVTWITGYLADTERCRWKAWVKSHYEIVKGVPGETPESKREGEDRMKQWIRNHDAMTDRRVALLRQKGFVVTVEDQNKFTLKGQVGTLAGKADLIAIDPAKSKAVIVDEKSGKEKPEHFWQVLIYMLAFSLTKLKGYELSGELEYPDNAQPIPMAELTQARKDKIFETMRWVSAPVKPPTTPSVNECRFCDVKECPSRVLPETQVADVQRYF